MTLRPSARCSVGTYGAAEPRGTKWNRSGRKANEKSTGALGFAAPRRRNPSRKAIPHNLFGGVAVGCLVLGCAWAVYSNIFAASVYPQLGSTNFDAPVVRHSSVVAMTKAPPAAHNTEVALLESAPMISAPATVPSGPSLSFDERFAAAAPQSVEPAPEPEAPKLAGRPKPGAAPE